MQVFLRDSADVRVTVIHRDVVKIVESAEDAELSKLGYAGQEAEADFAVAGLHDAVKSLQAAAVGFPKFFVASRIQ